MDNTLTLSLRMPLDLKERLKQQAKKQGISINQLVNYFVYFELTTLEVSEKFSHPKTLMSSGTLYDRLDKTNG